VFNVTRILRQVRTKGEPSLSKNVVQRSGSWEYLTSGQRQGDSCRPDEVLLNGIGYFL
jgi:hypothetical protein